MRNRMKIVLRMKSHVPEETNIYASATYLSNPRLGAYILKKNYVSELIITSINRSKSNWYTTTHAGFKFIVRRWRRRYVALFR